MTQVQELLECRNSRRVFIKRMTAAGIGAAALSLLEWSPKAMAAAGSPGLLVDAGDFPAAIPGENINIKVLNFALTLEYLEADLYRKALNSAARLPLNRPLASGIGAYKLKRGGGNLSNDAVAAGFEYLAKFAFAEQAHADFLRTAISGLNGTPVQPNPAGYRFAMPLVLNLQGYLTALLPLEQTGVRAYLGALPFLTDLTLATVAAGIFSVEARHTASVKYILDLSPGPQQLPGDLKVIPNYPSPDTLEYYLDPETVVSRVQAYIV